MKSSSTTWIIKSGTLEWWASLIVYPGPINWVLPLPYLLWTSNSVKYEIFVLGEVFDGSRCVLQPTSISTNGGTNRPVLVIVQNPGMSDFAFDVVKEPKKPKGSFNISPSFQETRRPSSLLPAATLKRSDSSPSLIRHEGLQLPLRSAGDLSTSTESGSRRDNQLPGICGRAVKEGSRCVDGKEDRNEMLFVNEVVVDVTALKGYSCLQFENSCGDSRTLHSRSSMSLQGFAPHLSSVVWFQSTTCHTLFVLPTSYLLKAVLLMRTISVM